MFPFRDFSNMMFPGHSRPFNNCYKCYSVSMLGTDREDVEKGGKIIMPPSALDQLSHSNVEYPMLFKLTNQKKTRQTHAGVLEFIADEGRIYIPFWMMHNLLLEEGDLLQVESISLPVATFSKFQPQSPDFLDITNPKAVLENALRNYACLTTGDLIAIKYNQKIYELCVLETKPGKAVSIIECDMNVDFAPPVGYQENHIQKENKAPEEDEDVEMYAEPSGFVAFSGEGNRLDGKKKKIEKQETITRGKQQVRGIPDYDHPFGLLKFNRSIKPISDRVPEEPKTDDDPTPGHFQGQGFSLKKGKK